MMNRWGLSVVALTILFFSLASFNLGSFKIPSSCWQPPPQGASITLDFSGVEQIKEIYIFLYDEKRTKFDVYRGGRKIYSYDNENRVHFRCWDKIPLNTNTSRLKLVFSGESVGKIGEVVVISAGNRRIEVIDVRGEEGAKRLVDEQEIVKLPITAQEGAYFDEMYFVRTAWEHLNLKEPYETTHPPLGKLIIAFGILCFGMNPFGWRIFGVLVATVMIPLIYVFAKRIYGGDFAGFFAALLLTFDFMHFSLARLATGEVYILFFSFLMYFFAFDYFRRVENEGSGARRSLLLSMIFFGFCFATKWIAVFGLFSIFVLLFLNDTTRRRIFSDIDVIFAGLLIDIAIYIATYIPYMLSGRGHSLFEVFYLQFGMFGYHALLEATHPFSSPWWSWHLMLRPLWLYFNSFDDKVSTIVLMGNPAIWWGSIPALVFLTIKIVRVGVKKKIVGRDFIILFIVVPYLMQWLLYALIPRILFIYHFAPNLTFIILSLTYWFDLLSGKKRLFVIPFLISVVILFFLFYPVISGYPIAYEYKESLRWLGGWVF
ncbi:MAG: glycosyltransferase family 39 protein [Candidatus Methanospirareceae archaeon]